MYINSHQNRNEIPASLSQECPWFCFWENDDGANRHQISGDGVCWFRVEALKRCWQQNFKQVHIGWVQSWSETHYLNEFITKKIMEFWIQGNDFDAGFLGVDIDIPSNETMGNPNLPHGSKVRFLNFCHRPFYLARFREQTQPISSISLGSIYLIDLKIPMFAWGITAGPAPIGQEANQLPRVRKSLNLWYRQHLTNRL